MATPTTPADLRARAGRWLEIDPDPETRAAIQAMLDADDVEASACISAPGSSSVPPVCGRPGGLAATG